MYSNKVTLVFSIFITNLVLSHGSKVSSFLGAAGVASDLRTRVKRQDLFPGNGQLAAVFCMQGCVQTFEAEIVTELGFETDEVSNGLINKQLFEDNGFQKFCKLYSETQRCMEKCGEFPGSELLRSAFAPMDYMCVEKYQAFVQNMACFRKAAGVLGDTCDNKCGGSNYVDRKVNELERMTEGNDISGMLDIMGQMCDYLACSLRCEIPTHEEVCQCREPGLLLSNFVAVAMGTGYETMKKAGVDDLFPQSCKTLVDEPYSSDSDTNSNPDLVRTCATTKDANSLYGHLLLILFCFLPLFV